MKHRPYLLVAVFVASYSCIASETARIEPEFRQSDKIEIQVHPYQNDPKNFLRLPHRSPERDIRISVKLNVDKIKAIDLIDLNSEEDRCERYHSVNVLYLNFDKPVSAGKIYSMITKPCIYQHNAKFKLKVTTGENEYLYRVQSFAVHSLSDDY